jgi:hypothetical protein
VYLVGILLIITKTLTMTIITLTMSSLTKRLKKADNQPSPEQGSGS